MAIQSEVKKDNGSNLHIVQISLDNGKIEGYLMTVAELNELRAKLDEYIRSLEK